MRTERAAMGPVAFAACGVLLAALSFGLGVAIGASVARRQYEREIAGLRRRIASIRAELTYYYRLDSRRPS